MDFVVALINDIKCLFRCIIYQQIVFKVLLNTNVSILETFILTKFTNIYSTEY